MPRRDSNASSTDVFQGRRWRYIKTTRSPSKPFDPPLHQPRRHRNQSPDSKLPLCRSTHLLLPRIRISERRRQLRAPKATNAVESWYGVGGGQGRDGRAAVFVLRYVGHIVVWVKDDLVR